MHHSSTTNLEFTISEYENVTLLTDFLSKFKSEQQNKNNITKIKFTPELKGYTINFIDDGVPSLINITFRLKIFHGLKITYCKENHKCKKYKSKKMMITQE